MLVLWILLSFFCGAVPFGVLIAKTFKGIDPRKGGSGNPGATNVARLCGLPYGLLTLVCDLLKGAIPVYLAVQLGAPTEYGPSAVALAAVLGHIKSPFLGFKGGKGVATTIGVFLPLAFIPLLCSLGVCLLVIAITGYVSAGSLAMVWVLPIFCLFLHCQAIIPLSMIICLIVIWTHRGNITRLILGQEKSWRKSKNPPAETEKK